MLWLKLNINDLVDLYVSSSGMVKGLQIHFRGIVFNITNAASRKQWNERIDFHCTKNQMKCEMDIIKYTIIKYTLHWLHYNMVLMRLCSGKIQKIQSGRNMQQQQCASRCDYQHLFTPHVWFLYFPLILPAAAVTMWTSKQAVRMVSLIQFTPPSSAMTRYNVQDMRDADKWETQQELRNSQG